MTEPPPDANHTDDADVLVVFMLDQPGMLDMILSQHVDDGGGYCPACPGPQSGRRHYPCDIRRAADRAASIRAARASQTRNTSGGGPVMHA